MDDLITGSNDQSKAERLARESTEILSQAGMPLLRWITNDVELQATLSPGEISAIWTHRVLRRPLQGPWTGLASRYGLLHVRSAFISGILRKPQWTLHETSHPFSIGSNL
jgi:hypothetical protein